LFYGGGLPQIAQQVRHRGRAVLPRRTERQAAHGPHLLLELARRAGIDRQVPRIVRPRGELVHHQLIAAIDEN
jgi:hypothetical protein